MRRLMILGAIVFSCLATDAQAGGWFRRRETVGGNNGPAMANVPHWAAERMSRYPAPLSVPQQGRRPWAYALANENTQSAHMARYYQLGGGVGPVPDASNGFSGPFGPFSTWNAAIP
ncbi:hypothetical protein EP7_004856 [Isosphaeraceae bacterium EP7]